MPVLNLRWNVHSAYPQLQYGTEFSKLAQFSLTYQWIKLTVLHDEFLKSVFFVNTAFYSEIQRIFTLWCCYFYPYSKDIKRKTACIESVAQERLHISDLRVNMSAHGTLFSIDHLSLSYEINFKEEKSSGSVKEEPNLYFLRRHSDITSAEVSVPVDSGNILRTNFLSNIFHVLNDEIIYYIWNTFC